MMASLGKLTLQKRITLLVLAGLTAGLGLFSWLGVQSLEASTERILEERLDIARLMANHLDETLIYIKVQLKNAVKMTDGLPDEEQFDALADSLLETFDELGISVQNIIIIDNNMKIIRVEPEDSRMNGANILDQPAVLKTLQTGIPMVSNLVSSPLFEVPVVFISAPIITSENIITGVLAISINIKQSGVGTFGQTLTVGETGYTEIVDENGVVLTRTSPGSPPALFERSDHPGKFAELIKQGQPTVGTCHRCHETPEAGPKRRDVLAFAPLSTTSWGVAIRQSEEEALAPTRQLEQRLLLLGTVVLVATFLLVWITMQGIVKPIKMLTTAAQKVAAGDFKAAVPVKRQDEIGQLSTAFHTMTQELAKSRDELVLRNEELKAYTAYVVRIQEEERQRISRELHDDAVQSLVLLCRRLDSALDTGEPLPPLHNDRLLEIKNMAQEIIDGLRDFTKALRPPILDDLGMVTSIRRMVTDITEREVAKGQLKVTGEERRLPSETELGIFRIAQEALRNVEHHAEATRVRVTITFTDDEVRLDVVDNGIGFSLSTVSGNPVASGQLGLISMQERAGLLGGWLKIKSAPGEGTRVTVSVPVTDDNQ